MAYDDTLPDDLNWVRFLIDDTGASPTLSDNEINAVLTEAGTQVDDSNGAKKYLASAMCLDRILTTYLRLGAGVGEKKVDDLEVKYGSRGSSVEKILRDLIKQYNDKAAELSTGSPVFFHTLRHQTIPGIDVGKVKDRLRR